MQLIRCLLSNFYLDIFRASLCPSSGEQDRVLLHMVFALVVLIVVGCGCVELRRELCGTQLTKQPTTASTTSAEHHTQ